MRVFQVRLVLLLSMVCCERYGLFGPAVISCFILSLNAQSPAHPTAKSIELKQTRYELQMGQPVPLVAPSETVDFLRNATSRTVKIGDVKAAGLVVGTNRAGQMVLAASPLAKPGEYEVTVSATSAAGEERQATLTAAVTPLTTVPSGSTRNPVVLLNGWEQGFTGSCPISSGSSDTFGNLAQYLLADGVPVVYLFDNCAIDPNQTVETLGNDLAAFLQSIKYDSGAQVPQIDLVAFSLGGLVARSYLAGLQPNATLLPPAATLVGSLVLIATPNFGSFLAGNNSIVVDTLGTQSAELLPGSSFLWNLSTWNQFSDDLRGVSAIAVIGNAGQFVPNLSSTTALNNASDGIVSLASASAGFATKQASVTRIVPYCHVDPSVFINTSLGAFNCNAAGIANVTSESHYTSEIVRSFLAGTSDWTSIGSTPATDPYLSKDGGTFFALVSESNNYASDLTNVTWGSSQMVNGGDAGTIYSDDFAAGTGVFDATSTSLGTLNCQSYTQPAGYFFSYRCKIDAAIVSVGPLISTIPRVVGAGGIITISGADFGGQCNGCKVTATPAGSATGVNLVISSWKSTAIAVALPADLTGLLILTVYASSGTDSVAIMSALSNPSVIAVSPATLAFSYTTGGTVPAAASIQIANSGSGTLSWSATASASWLTVSPASGTAPTTLSVSVSPAGLSPGTYAGNVAISASGASNTPLSIAVTLTVTQAPPALAISPQALTFNYSVGGSAPAAQTVSITNTGAGTLSYTAAASSSPYWLAVSPASGSTPGTLSVSINPANLAAGTYTAAVQVTAAGAIGSPFSVAITLAVQGTQPAGTITAVANAGSFQPGVASATWIAILGSNLSTTTYTWQASDFVNGMLPTSLQGVSVTIDGLPALVEYISPTQINVLAPDDASTGPVQVQVTAAQLASNSLTVQESAFFPALFTIANGMYVAALHLDYSLVGSAGLLPGVTSTPAQPGETIAIYATGFGPTNPASPTAQLVATPEPLANSVQVTIGGVAASVTYAGLVGPGTYQLNVTVPNLPAGDAPVVATVGNFTTQTGVSVTVGQ
jgi:uncharacterized protein (TIGR03437 family)